MQLKIKNAKCKTEIPCISGSSNFAFLILHYFLPVIAHTEMIRPAGDHLLHLGVTVDGGVQYDRYISSLSGGCVSGGHLHYRSHANDTGGEYNCFHR
jgi:hypothetical protein